MYNHSTSDNLPRNEENSENNENIPPIPKKGRMCKYFLLFKMYLTCIKMLKQVYYFVIKATIPMDDTASTALKKIADAITTISAIPEPAQLPMLPLPDKQDDVDGLMLIISVQL